MASLLDFFMAPSAGLLSGNVGPVMPRASGLLDAPGFGPAPASDSTLTRLREWAGQQLNPASLADFPSPQGFAAPSFAQPMEPNPYIRAAASFVPVLGDALDIADVGRRAMNDPASLSGWDALSMLPMVPLATAWHGSPHRFDKFSLKHIGSGEGAQAYGHGLYFAEDPEVARHYQPASMSIDVDYSRMHARDDSASAAAYVAILENRGDLPAAKDSLIRQAAILERNAALKPEDADAFLLKAGWRRRGAELIDEGLYTPKNSDSSFYKVDIPDEAVARFLDWDAPLSEQPAAVREALRRAGVDEEIAKVVQEFSDLPAIQNDWRNPDISSVVNLLSERWGSPEAASRKLLELGVPGIKYFDGNSRTAGEGTRNFVVFDDELIKILERNGEAMQ